MGNPLTFFDAVYVLASDNADSNPPATGKRLDRLSIPYQVFLVGDPPVELPKRLSSQHTMQQQDVLRHRTVLEEALAQNKQKIIVFEDRVLLRDDLPEQLEKLVGELKSIHWEVVHLGLHLTHSGGMCTENLGYVRFGSELFAYAVTAKAARQIIDLIDRGLETGVDLSVKLNNPHLLRLYCFPILAIPEPRPHLTWELMPPQLSDYCQLFDPNLFVENCSELRELSRGVEGGYSSRSNSEFHGKMDVETAFSLAVVRHDSGELALADQLYHFVLQRQPDHPEALHKNGRLAWQTGDLGRATDFLYRAIVADSSRAEFHVTLAMLFLELGRASDALQLLDSAILLNSGRHEVLNARGIVLRRMNRNVEARQAWERALELEPDYVEPMRWIGNCLFEEQKPKEALDYLEKAHSLAPSHVDIQRCMGNTLLLLGKPDEAVRLLAQAASTQPLRPDIQSDLGLALQQSGNVQDAIIYLRRAVSIRHNDAQARFNLSLALLQIGEFNLAWPDYEWRRSLLPDQVLNRQFIQPEWNGSDLSGRTILVITEQGFGDTLQFVRYIPTLRDAGARVILECQAELVPLLSQMEAADKIIGRGNALPEFDTHVRLMSVPGILHTDLNSIPSRIPYLRADEKRVKLWKSRLPSGFRVGIVWSGNPGFLYNSFRSAPLSEFEPLANVSGVNLVSLQQGAAAKDLAKIKFPVVSFPEFSLGGGFLDTAAILENLDLFITTDTSPAHLAGAMGIKTWTALSFSPDWRWLRERRDCPWYPTMRLYRQPQLGDWTQVFQEIQQDLQDIQKK